jgi:protein arginine kinase activator
MADIWKLLQYSAQQTRKRAVIRCPDCGMTLEEFRKKGRLGCPKDYEVFRPQIDELLERVHGATEHRGRVPGLSEKELLRIQRMTDLQQELENAIREEAYENAARIRDELKELEVSEGSPSAGERSE